MPQAKSVHSTAPTNTPIDSTRRGFLGGTAAALAAGTAVNVVALVATRPATASPSDDSALLALEEEYFNQDELAHSYDDEIDRVADIWQAKSREIYGASLDGSCPLTVQERSDIISEIPECKEHTRLDRLQNIHFEKMDAIVKQMWATPALTPEGRRAKVLVALNLLPSSWRHLDENTDYGVRETRQLLIEFIGGEPGEQLREQFA
jgi:hypothetical protein